MSGFIGLGRDAAEGYVYLYGPELVLGASGPERVDTSSNDPDVTPPRLLGFTPPPADPVDEPLTWDGDDA